MLPLCQIALSSTHLLRTHFWYCRALGLVPGGACRHLERPGPAHVAGLPELTANVWCLLDRRDWFQFEAFEFERPRMRAMPPDWRPSDIGYSTIGFHVQDFDEALHRLRMTSGRTLTDPIGGRGRRRVCLRDPDGVLIELMEEDVTAAGDAVRADVPATTRFVTLSVPDLERAERFWIGALGLHRAGTELHQPEHEALWGLDGARPRRLVLDAAGVCVELVQYETPGGRPRPAGYLPSDQGIFNVAFGSSDKRAFDAAYRRIRDCGYRFNSEPWTLSGVATVVYVTDDSGFSVELLHVEPAGLEHMGFLPGASTPDAHALQGS